MKVHALCSWYQEQPEHLAELVASVAPLVDSVVAVDGAYALYPAARRESSPVEHWAISDACREHGLNYFIHTPHRPWKGNEVEKRAYMFKYALHNATPYKDWFLIMDADMLMCQRGDPERARAKLVEAGEGFDVGGVTFGELPWGATLDGYDVLTSTTAPFRSIFRALPGLTVEWAHYFYNVVNPDGSRRYLWYDLPGRYGSYKPQSDVAVVDLMDEVRLLHRPWARENERVRGKLAYHDEASLRVIERVPPMNG